MGLDVALDCGTSHEPKSLAHKIQKTLMFETDSPETINEAILAVRKMGRIGIIAAYAGFANGINIGAIMECGIRLIGNGQAPVHLYWEEILNDYLLTGKFDTKFLVTHRIPIDDFAELYAAFDSRLPASRRCLFRLSSPIQQQLAILRLPGLRTGRRHDPVLLVNPSVRFDSPL
ncbi:hypothetical protein FRB94_005946 [Tulasnella sp. JGI-2019a]|nr:hypothetical protein FRB93_006585 [Tulasnella sp. JGI-2019a]KAG8999772.1 hypothetical protein FRB94_005946 [Tulasnella sp. JGI-2019a]KAG9026823.1 hypothetical protein FRB95_008403 [Tulasnella sp. JGI-2019a]